MVLLFSAAVVLFVTIVIGNENDNTGMYNLSNDLLEANNTIDTLNNYASAFHALIAVGVDINTISYRYGKALIYSFSIEGDPNAVNALIEVGADLNLQDISGKTALAWTIERGHTDVEACLIAAGAQ